MNFVPITPYACLYLSCVWSHLDPGCDGRTAARHMYLLQLSITYWFLLRIASAGVCQSMQNMT